MYLMDERGMIDAAKIEGKTEERAKAKQEKLEIARKMKNDKLPIDRIAQYTGLSKSYIEKL